MSAIGTTKGKLTKNVLSLLYIHKLSNSLLLFFTFVSVCVTVPSNFTHTIDMQTQAKITLGLFFSRTLVNILAHSYFINFYGYLSATAVAQLVKRSLRMRKIGLRYPVAKDLSRVHWFWQLHCQMLGIKMCVSRFFGEMTL